MRNTLPVVRGDTTMNEELESQVIGAVRRHLRVPEQRIDGETRLGDDLGADSLALAELALVFETAFEVDIDDDDAAAMRTVRDAVAAVERGLREKRNA